MNLDTVVKFARARHNLWEGKPVKSAILTNRKFTNVFRVLDRGSQYLISLMDVHEDPLDRLAVSYFYRQVNRPDTMAAIIAANDGYVPDASDIFNPKWYLKSVAPVIEDRPGAFLNGAYIILIKPGDSRGTLAKMTEVFPDASSYLTNVAREPELAARVRLLQKTPGVGPFLAMQVATDLGYCAGETDQENTFVLAGPGSRNGVKVISNEKPEDVIKNFPVDRLPPLPHSNGRLASWMDIQNVFCEFSKYARLANKRYTSHGTSYHRNGEFDTVIPLHFIRKD